MNKIIIKQRIVFPLLVSVSLVGCGSSDEPETSIFDNARLINLEELPSYDLITESDNGTSSLKSSTVDNKSQSGSEESIAVQVMMLIKNQSFNAVSQNKSRLTKSIITDTEFGNISGSRLLNIDVNISTGDMSGTMTFNNYEDVPGDACGATSLGSMDGSFNITGKINLTTAEIVSMQITAGSVFTVGDSIWLAGASSSVVYDHQSGYQDDATMTINLVAKKDLETIGLKNFSVRSYTDSAYEYSYPLKGNLYIFTNNFNGYFSVDSSYDHSSTPTIADLCGFYTYSGKEKYVGLNSSLTWTVTSTNNYQIELDNNNDNVIDEVFNGVID